MEFQKSEALPGIIIVIDFQKAFDSVDWDYILQALKAFNFGESVLNWVKIFYRNIHKPFTKRVLKKCEGHETQRRTSRPNPTAVITGNDGNPIINTSKVHERWVEYFGGLLNNTHINAQEEFTPTVP